MSSIFLIAITSNVQFHERLPSRPTSNASAINPRTSCGGYLSSRCVNQGMLQKAADLSTELERSLSETIHSLFSKVEACDSLLFSVSVKS